MAIRNTARALLIQDGHVLMAKYEDFQGEIFYVLPGGGQEQGEPIHDTLHRECMEEVGIEVEVDQLAFICEKLFREDNHHQIDFVFAVKPKSPTASVHNGIELDPGQLGIEWLPLEKIMEYRVFPMNIRRHLQTWGQEPLTAPIYKLTVIEKQFSER